jgi:micrococcal nuclease
LLVLLAWAARLSFRGTDGPPTLPEANRLHVVARVVDGDTLVLDSGQRVRLIGVDTPETVHPQRPPEPLGPEASEFTRRLVEGRPVRLEFDRERWDAYQRVLAYVYVDDLLLNEELIRAGLSRAFTTYPFRSDMQRRFRAAEAEARAGRRGLWGLDAPRMESPSPP